jgi:hypothetical protein
MYSTKAPPKDFMNRKYKNSIFQAWKWHTILFQISLTTEVIITIIFWPILYTPAPAVGQFKNVDLYQASKIIDNYLPLVILLIDFFLSNPVFLIRHMFFSLAYGFMFVFTNMIVSLADEPPYSLMSWRSASGVLIPLLLILMFPIVHILLFYVIRWRLQRDQFKNHTILKVL